jgi:hypothetical protein
MIIPLWFLEEVAPNGVEKHRDQYSKMFQFDVIARSELSDEATQVHGWFGMLVEGLF